ncbi:MAG: multidrug effflux MFS transporter [Stagnimonas sp.]|nr:multidrug effflux MFS transporter [Stagnimonas sp.]
MKATARRLAPLLAALAMLGPFSIDTFFPAFRVMGAHFNVSPAAMQQTISIYLAVYAGMSLFHGPLSDAYGRRRVIIFFSSLFAVASLGCALAPTFGALLGFRALQGVAAGAGLIVGRAIIRDRFGGADAQRLMSQVTLIFGIAPAIAPVIGGWLLTLTGEWRPLFGFLCGFSLLLTGWCVWMLPETHAETLRTPLRPRILTRTYAAMLRDGPFRWLALAAGFNFGALFIYIASAPALILDVLKLGERDFAWLFVPTIGGMMIGAAVAGRLAGKRTPSQMMRLCYRLIAIGAVVNLLINVLLPPGVPWTVLPICILGIGMSLGFPTLSLVILDRFPATRGAGSSLQTALSLLMMSVLSGVVSPWVAHHPMGLALTSAGLSTLGYLCWKRAKSTLDIPALVPTSA